LPDALLHRQIRIDLPMSHRQVALAAGAAGMA